MPKSIMVCRQCWAVEKGCYGGCYTTKDQINEFGRDISDTLGSLDIDGSMVCIPGYLALKKLEAATKEDLRRTLTANFVEG